LDIKLKNIKYLKSTKAAAAIIIWLCFLAAFISALFLISKEYVSQYLVALLISSTILMISAFTYLACVTGRSSEGGETELLYVDRIYTDVHTFLVFMAAVASLALVFGFGFHPSSVAAAVIYVSIILSIDVFIGLSYMLSMIRQIKRRQIVKNSLIFKIYIALKNFIKLSYNGKVFKAWTLLLLLAYGLVNGILFSAVIQGRHEGFFRFVFFVILWLAFNGFSIYLSAKPLISLAQIMATAKEISKGNLDYTLDAAAISAPFSDFAGDILNIQGGLKEAVSEAVKGERMKADLITNVSHDLKTPLTSIINYVDLLKKEDLKNENAIGYIGILEEKSSRLKQLIEDLIEASKASSGNLPVSAEKVNLHELVMQACGEYEEKFKKASLDMRIDSSDKSIFILADGKHMWRIMENLLSNAVKYSMPSSRVYINIDKDDSCGRVTIKNISALPLNIPPEQLTERFVRGDPSRATEGSGLGLSIAQSLSSLQGGRFRIYIDGDLFKAAVEIPLWHDN
jgi:signal transduction histidine kinase